MLDQTAQAEPNGTEATEDERSLELRTALAVTVARRIREAKDARSASGIEDIWEEDADQYDGVDSLAPATKGATETGPRKDGRSRVFLNITKPKTDIAVARVQEMLVPTDDKPWEICPTPIPELSEAAAGGADQMLTLADGTQAPAKDVAKATLEIASQKAEKMADWVEDQFVEGSVYAELRKVIRDAGRLGTGILKGPYPVMRTERRWQISDGAAMLAITEKASPTSSCIDPRDFFPDPSCGENIHDGSYVVERDYMTSRQLRKLARVEGYDAAAIAEAIKQGPQQRARDRDRYRDQPGETVNDSEVYEVFYYYGDVEPEVLIAMGVDQTSLREEDLYLQAVPSIVTMVNDRPIKAVVNPLDSGEFPYDVFPWEAKENQPWGTGIPRKMAVAQRMLNAATRALLENAGLSAGPQIAITRGALIPANNKYEITGRKLWFFEPTDLVTDIAKAMRVWSIPSAQQELSNIITFALQMADELTNLPMLMQGQQGTAPELLGGMKMLMANASAPLRVVAKAFDDCLITPHLRRYYDWGMQSGPEDAKGDLQIKARGSSALVQREIAREFLAQAYQMAQRPNSRINPDKLDEELMKAHGVNMSTIAYTDAELQQKQEAAAQQPPPQDPRIEAARIRAESDKAKTEAASAAAQQELQFKAQDNAEMRAIQIQLAEVQKQIQIMRMAAEENMQIGDIKAQLAQTAIASRDKRELFAAERAMKFDPANRDPQNQGI
jgi:hypothetical protein